MLFQGSYNTEEWTECTVLEVGSSYRVVVMLCTLCTEAPEFIGSVTHDSLAGIQMTPVLCSPCLPRDVTAGYLSTC